MMSNPSHFPFFSLSSLFFVIPAEAGIQTLLFVCEENLDSRFRWE